VVSPNAILENIFAKRRSATKSKREIKKIVIVKKTSLIFKECVVTERIRRKKPDTSKDYHSTRTRNYDPPRGYWNNIQQWGASLL
jgi:hypothetical protein